MIFKETKLQGCYIIEPKIILDERGYFMESFNEKTFQNGIGQAVHFVQDNQSFSTKGVLRGLHYQTGEYAQAKLVRVLHGEVLDVAVDLRPNSPTFGQYESVLLTTENQTQFFVPRGFAHGFLVLSDEAVFSYKVDNDYAPNEEASIRFDDPQLGIEWPVKGVDVVTSDKDLNGKSFKEANLFE